MKILLFHNFYRQSGGEDVVFRDETTLLESKGHAVRTFTRDNARLADRECFAAAVSAVWNAGTYRQVKGLLSAFQPDVAVETSSPGVAKKKAWNGYTGYSRNPAGCGNVTCC